MTPGEFIEACHAGNLSAVRAALDAGISPDTSLPFDDGETTSQISALYHACVGDHPDVVQLLLERGANPDDGESVYHAAELNRVACLALLLLHGASLSGLSQEHGNTPLYFLSAYRESHPHGVSAAAGMLWLLQNGADPNVASMPSKEMPLHRAAAIGRKPVVEMLLAHGAAPDAARADGRTPYALAMRGGHREIAALLAQRGASMHTLGPVDELISACASGDEPAARDVLARHPGLIAGFSPADQQSFIEAVHDEREEAVRTMAAVGFDLRWEGEWAGTPLHHAAWLGQVSLSKLLIGLGAPLDVRDRQFGSSPIGWAAHGSRNHHNADDDYLAIIEALIAAGSARAPSYNKWNEPPESLGSERVDARLRRWAEASR